jgi:hypothetical protein
MTGSIFSSVVDDDMRSNFVVLVIISNNAVLQITMWRPMVRTIQKRQRRSLSFPTMKLSSSSSLPSISKTTSSCFSTSSSLSTASASSLSHERGMILAGVAGAIISTGIYFTTTTRKKPSSQTPNETATSESLQNDGDHASTSAVVDSETTSASTNTELQQQEENEEDPYENLPEEDEETDCSMCRTFRKGPCRPYWRKLERCLKDHESSENVGAACLKYFTPHSSCLLEYTNLYHLVSLELKQELVNDAELAVRTHERRCWVDTTNTMIHIDWKPWIEFFQQTGPSFQQTFPQQPSSPSTAMDTSAILKEKEPPIPLWQRLPENTEPILVATKTHIPSIQEDMVLKIAYAVDQDGMVLGLSYNKAYGDLVEQTREPTPNSDNGQKPPSSSSTTVPNASDASNSESSLSEEGNLETSKTENSEPRPHDPEDESSTATVPDEDSNNQTTNNDSYEFEFHIFPGETKSVQVCAMYSENPMQAPAEKKILDVLLYKSRTYDLERIAGEKSNIDDDDSTHFTELNE